MATTLKDIAERLEISKGVVSRVLNGKPGSWASSEMQQRIFEVAQELNYQPSASARALTTGRTWQFAVSLSDTDFHKGTTGRLQEISGLIMAAAHNGYRLLLLADSAPGTSFREVENAQVCDGFFVFAEQITPELGLFLDCCQLPFVVIGDAGNDRWPRVDLDNEQYIKSSVTWLRERGHTRIAFIASDFPYPALRRKHNAFQNAIREQGLEQFEQFNPKWPLSTDQVKEYLDRAYPSAILVGGLADTLICQRAVELSCSDGTDAVQILSHLDPAELTFLRRSELSKGMAFHVYDPQITGQIAIRAMMNAVDKQGAPTTTLTVASTPFREGEAQDAPFWDRMPHAFQQTHQSPEEPENN